MKSLLYDAKDLIYWALGMDYVFVPELSSRYSAESDKWKLRYLKEKKKSHKSMSGYADDGEGDAVAEDGYIEDGNL